MTNEITISITASGKDALKILKALSTLDGVAVTTATNKKAPVKDKPITAVEGLTGPIPGYDGIVTPAECATPLKTLQKAARRKSIETLATGRFDTREELFTYFFNHSDSGAEQHLTVREVSESAEVTRQIAYVWQRKSGHSFRKTKAPVKDKPTANPVMDEPTAYQQKDAVIRKMLHERSRGRSTAKGRFASSGELFNYFFNHSDAGAEQHLTVMQVSTSAGVSKQVAYGWQRRTGHSFKKGERLRKS